MKKKVICKSCSQELFPILSAVFKIKTAQTKFAQIIINSWNPEISYLFLAQILKAKFINLSILDDYFDAIINYLVKCFKILNCICFKIIFNKGVINEKQISNVYDIIDD